jgi:hypothetical protein
MIDLSAEVDLPEDVRAVRRAHLLGEIERASPPRARGVPRVVPTAAVAVLVVVAGWTVLRTGGEGHVLAYRLEQGDEHVYSFDSMMVSGSSRTVSSGEFEYTIAQGPSAGTRTVTVQITTDAHRQVLSDGGGHAADRLPSLPYTWADIRSVVDAKGTIVEMDVENQAAIPGFALADPTPGDVDFAFPFRLGPQFPDAPLDVGDSWTTREPKWVPDEIVEVTDPDSVPADRPGHTITITGTHVVSGEDDSDGRSTLVIETTYVVPAYGTGELRVGERRATTKIWFDPSAGMIVRAELTSAGSFIDERNDLISEQRDELTIDLVD